jgi:ribonuclease P protein component
MLPSKKRLSRPDFDNFLVSKDIKVVFNNLGTLKYKKSIQNQASVVISSKYEKRAVYRNKLRRRLYSLFGVIFKNPNKPKQYVLYISKQAPILDFEILKDKFYELIKKTTK